MATLVMTTIATSCDQSELNMAGLLGYSLCVPLLDIYVRQLSTTSGLVPIFGFSLA
jgi:hypothetical protein